MGSLAATMLLFGYSKISLPSTHYQTEICYTLTNFEEKNFFLNKIKLSD